eukprot:GEMP01043851.1.p1 GENE.GEMP01043851.1~~GEMP01043851.1.p1  ORF type:complete len:334 (+),score=54.27 GEMP01043851.1:214-1215(+)
MRAVSPSPLVSRQSHVHPDGLRSTTFRKSNVEQVNTCRSGQPRSAHGVLTPGVEANISCLMQSSKRTNVESVAGVTAYRRSTVGPEGRNTAVRHSTATIGNRQSPLEGSSRSLAFSRGGHSPEGHNDSPRCSAATHAVSSASTSPKKSGRSLHAPTTQDGRMPSVELSPKASCNAPGSSSPTSSNALRSPKGSVSPAKKDRFGAMLTQARSRSLSIESLKVVVSLEEFYAKYVDYEKQMRALIAGVNDGQINPGDAKTKLALLESGLSKLQGNGIDSVKTTHLVSGQATCKKLRKELTLKTERILNYVETIFPMLTTRTSIYFTNLEAANKAS